ncbi:hypothetical protein LCM4579_26970 [Ensifer sp. LCM 4579]|nr:hypothetical protein LCM4579_26970 [Ensifer sp. LCM 4579]
MGTEEQRLGSCQPGSVPQGTGKRQARFQMVKPQSAVTQKGLLGPLSGTHHGAASASPIWTRNLHRRGRRRGRCLRIFSEGSMNSTNTTAAATSMYPGMPVFALATAAINMAAAM